MAEMPVINVTALKIDKELLPALDSNGDSAVSTDEVNTAIQQDLVVLTNGNRIEPNFVKLFAAAHQQGDAKDAAALRKKVAVQETRIHQLEQRIDSASRQIDIDLRAYESCQSSPNMVCTADSTTRRLKWLRTLLHL